jgi:hypothetical protein
MTFLNSPLTGIKAQQADVSMIEVIRKHKLMHSQAMFRPGGFR